MYYILPTVTGATVIKPDRAVPDKKNTEKVKVDKDKYKVADQF